MSKPKLTRFQRECYTTLCVMCSGAYADDGSPRWLPIEYVGGRQVWWHLQEKGLVDLENRPGPRGGEHWYVRLRTI